MPSTSSDQQQQPPPPPPRSQSPSQLTRDVTSPSPSPPPPVPVPTTPGPRASRLQRVYAEALSRTIRANSYPNFAACFPTPAKHVPVSLESLWRQLNAKLEESAKAEFNDIIRERDVVKGMNELDRLVSESRRRKDNGENENPIPLHTLGADGLYQAHLTPYLQQVHTTLEAKFETTQSQNAELVQRIQAQRQEIEGLISGLEAVVEDLECAAKASTEFSKEHNLRQESLQMDQEVRAKADT